MQEQPHGRWRQDSRGIDTPGAIDARWSGRDLTVFDFEIKDIPGEQIFNLQAGHYLLGMTGSLDATCTRCNAWYRMGLEVLEVPAAPVPEPSTLTLGRLGLGFLACRAHRRRTAH